MSQPEDLRCFWFFIAFTQAEVWASCGIFENVVEAYALLDQGATSSLIRDDLAGTSHKRNEFSSSISQSVWNWYKKERQEMSKKPYL